MATAGILGEEGSGGERSARRRPRQCSAAETPCGTADLGWTQTYDDEAAYCDPATVWIENDGWA
ncbi:MAG TPA: hypothetical protein VFA37_01035 [Gaiellaceae bacterium]|nr:hypothetical protein [Gaiellaceae bacterium]